MLAIPHARKAAATAIAVAVTAAIVLPATAASAEPPEAPPAAIARKELAGLTITTPHSMAGYSRAKFPHWITQHGTCDTREVVLQRDGRGVTTDAQCRAISGTWVSDYDGKTFTSASQLDIDHVVPLANAWRSGADTWTTPQRQRFANDLTNPQLIAVSASSNRAKGDQSPDQWKPPLTSYWCTYARMWTHIKHLYALNVTQPEETSLNTMLDTCT
ncbi:HNH endonuclease family protein [Actinoallomurus sp. CA-150999]|uniref:HNH endonuclease family protein n=1 Tax=Actinoallomurus sp. CA-150999 TaxID=3239887 RepID=UPI003D933AA6